ncbi:MAG: DEAD/DEAH box helicase [Actinobacteria bacterium]|nr:DEAD/DEAH box helicase [Actinomycetota bacterium]
MPKSPTGARAPKNYDPRYGDKKVKPRHKSGSAGTPDVAEAGARRGSRDERPRSSRDDRTSRADTRADTRGDAGQNREQRRSSLQPTTRPARDRDERSERDESPYRSRTRSEKPRTDRAGTDRPRAERSRSDGARSDGVRSERPTSDRRSTPRWDRDDRPRDDRPREDRPREDRPRSERPASGRSRSDGARSERPTSDRRSTPRWDRDDRSRDDRPRSDRPRTERPGTDRPRGDRFGTDRPRTDRPRTDRPRRDDWTNDRPARGRDDREQRGGGFMPPEDVVLDRLDAAVVAPEDSTGMSFGDLGLGDNICRQLANLGAASPFPIQAATIPIILTGRDVLGRGRTGSGKTIAFGAPLVERLLADGPQGRKQGRPARALILAPTRELAMQIDRTVQPIARSVGLFTTTIYGGVPQHKQTLSLRKGVDILIATPGRLEDLIEQRLIDLSHISITVLDEADHMCDLGFLEPVQRILRQTDPDGQRLLFSATLDSGVSTIVKEFLKDPGVYEVSGEDQDSATIDHRVFMVESRDKVDIIAQLAAHSEKVLVFTRTRAFADMLADGLDDRGVPATSLHGDLNQAKRTRNLERLSSGRVHVLVATDVAARGIHVDDVDLVVQADPPDDYKSYMHRSGRTGRAGREGVVVTLIPKSRQRRMNELLERAGITAPTTAVRPGDDAIVNLLG